MHKMNDEIFELDPCNYAAILLWEKLGISDPTEDEINSMAKVISGLCLSGKKFKEVRSRMLSSKKNFH